MSDTRNVIVRLLRNLGSRNEVEQYLKEFSSIDSRKFAVIKVGGGILQDDLESLASSLSFLHQVGLYPIVVHGAGPQLNAALEEEGIETRRVDGMRVTDQKTLEVARRVFLRENLKLVEALEELGTRARPLTSGVFEATLMDEERYGLVGEISSVNLEPIRSCIRARCLPILARSSTSTRMSQRASSRSRGSPTRSSSSPPQAASSTEMSKSSPRSTSPRTSIT
jgi:acetylglutamate kinase